MTLTNGYNIYELSTRELVTLLEFIDGIMDTIETESDALTPIINDETEIYRAQARGQRSVYDNMLEDFGMLYDGISDELFNRWARK